MYYELTSINSRISTSTVRYIESVITFLLIAKLIYYVYQNLKTKFYSLVLSVPIVDAKYS